MFPVSLAIECAEGWQNLCLDAIDGHWAGVVLEFVLLFYAFAGLAIVCDEYLVPSLETLCLRWGVREDVAGASFMAFGSAAPEIIINAVTTMKGSEDVELGVGAIIGSGMIAFMCIPSMCTLLSGSGEALIIKRRPLLRDVIFYSASLTALCVFFSDGEIHIHEGAILISIYVVYLLVVFFSPQIRTWWTLRSLPDAESRSQYILERSVSFVSRAGVSVAGSSASSAALLADRAAEDDDDDDNISDSGAGISRGEADRDKIRSGSNNSKNSKNKRVQVPDQAAAVAAKLGRAAPGAGTSAAGSVSGSVGGGRMPQQASSLVGNRSGGGVGPLSLNKGRKVYNGDDYVGLDSDGEHNDYFHDDDDDDDSGYIVKNHGLSSSSKKQQAGSQVISHSALLSGKQRPRGGSAVTITANRNGNTTPGSDIATAPASTATADVPVNATTLGSPITGILDISNTYDENDANAAACERKDISIAGSAAGSSPGLLKSTPRSMRVSFAEPARLDLDGSTSQKNNGESNESAKESGPGVTVLTINDASGDTHGDDSHGGSSPGTATGTQVTNVPAPVAAPSAARRALLRQISLRGLPDAAPSAPAPAARHTVARSAVLRQINLRGLRLARGYPGYGVSERAREAKAAAAAAAAHGHHHHGHHGHHGHTLHAHGHGRHDGAAARSGYVAPKLVHSAGGDHSLVVVPQSGGGINNNDGHAGLSNKDQHGHDHENSASRLMPQSATGRDPHYGTLREGTGVVMLGDDGDSSDCNSDCDSDGKALALSEEDEEEEPPGCVGKTVGVLTAPLKFLFRITCPHAVPGGPWERWYLPAFAISFLWVAVFAMIISAVVGQWVDKVNVSMEFFGLVLVAGGAEIPDMIQSVTVARRGYGSMATSNCIGSQITNILVGLGLPWFISVLATGKPILVPGHQKLFRAAVIQSANIFIFFAVTLGAAFVMRKNKVELSIWKGRLNLSLYVLSIAIYAFITFCTYSWCSSQL